MDYRLLLYLSYLNELIKMILVISPSKTLDFSEKCKDEHTIPDFLKESIGLIEVLRKLTTSEIAELMDFKGNINWLSNKPDGQYRKPSSNTKLINVVGDYNFTPLREGLKITIDWFIDNYDNVRK